MSRYAWIPILLLLGVGTARAEQASPACAVAIADTVRATGLVLDHLSPSGETAWFRHEGAAEFMLRCPSPVSANRPYIHGRYDGAYPPTEFFEVIAEASHAAMAADASDAKAASIECQRRALQSSSEQTEANHRHVHVECSRDLGDTSIDVFWRSK